MNRSFKDEKTLRMGGVNKEEKIVSITTIILIEYTKRFLIS